MANNPPEPVRGPNGYIPDNAGSAGGVTSFESRTGAVVAQAGDYAASEITNDSAVAGADVTSALDRLVQTSGAFAYPGASAPASPNALDDELDTVAVGVPAGFSLWDNSGTIYPSVPEVSNANRGLLLNPASVNEVGGIVKAAPVGDFSMYLWLNPGNPGVAGASLGLLLAGDVVASPAAAPADVIGLFPQNGGRVWLGGRQTWSNFGAPGAFNATLETIGNGVWARCRYDSGANLYYSEFSLDGLQWQRIVAGGNIPPAVPTYIGIGGHNATATALQAYCRHFRVSSSIDFNDPVPSLDYA